MMEQLHLRKVDLEMFRYCVDRLEHDVSPNQPGCNALRVGT